MRNLLVTGSIVMYLGACGDFDDFDRRWSQRSDAGSDASTRYFPRPGASSADSTAPPSADLGVDSHDIGAPPPGTCGDGFETEVFKLTNHERTQRGLPPYLCGPKAGAVAHHYSVLMCQAGHFQHTGPDGSTPMDRLKQGGVAFFAAGENIAAGAPTPAAVMAGWMGSPGHRSNILSSVFTHLGVGYAHCNKGYKHYWTQNFFK